MGVRRIGALVLAAVLATGLAACGDDDGGDDVSLEDVEGNEDDSGSEDEASEDDSSSDDEIDLGAFGSERCQELFGALSGFTAAFGGGEGEFDFGDFADAFEALADEAPEIEDELGVLADAYREFDEALGGEVDFSDPDIFTSSEFAEASEAFASSEVTEASEAVSSFLEEECSTG